MITLMQVVVYTQLRINLGGNWNIWINYGTSFLLTQWLLVFSVMCLYPGYTLSGLAPDASALHFWSFPQIWNSLLLSQWRWSWCLYIFFQMYDYTMSLGYQNTVLRRAGRVTDGTTVCPYSRVGTF